MDKVVKCKDLPYSRYEIENLKAAAEEFKKANAAARLRDTLRRAKDGQKQQTAQEVSAEAREV